MTVTLSPPHCSLSDLCDRRSCCVTANQLMTKFVSISCATLPWAAAVLSMGVNVPRIFVNVPNARIFATTAGIVGCQREQPVDGSRMLPTAFLSKPSRGRERNPPPPLPSYFTWHASTQPLVQYCLSVDMMLRQRLKLNDKY